MCLASHPNLFYWFRNEDVFAPVFITSFMSACCFYNKSKQFSNHYGISFHNYIHTKISKSNLADVGTSQCMHWLTKYINKRCHAHSDMHSITLPHYSTPMHPYISSSKFSANWCATATYAWSACVSSGTSLCAWHITVCMALLVLIMYFFQPVHSCIEPSLHQLNFF